MLHNVDWETCPIGFVRKSTRLNILKVFQMQKEVCGIINHSDLPAWVLRDLNMLNKLQAIHNNQD